MFTMKAVYRFILRQTMRPFIQRREYGVSSDVPFYRGWLELPVFGCIAFIKTNGDLQYRW